MNIGGSNKHLAAKIQGILAEKLGQGTAVSAAFIREGELVAAAAAGTQDGDPAHPATIGDLYNIGSVSKVYCAMSVLKLVEMGKADLDTPVYRYLPRFTMLDPRYRDITLRMCINHSSGLPGTGNSNSFATKFIGEAYYDMFYDYLSKCRLKADPGTCSVYCNDGFTLAEIAVAALSGMTFTAFVQKYLTMPLGCISTCSGENNPAGRTLIRLKGQGPEYLSVLGSGGISTDLTDCARFGWAFLEPGVAFTAQSAALSAVAQRLTFLGDDAASPFGLGWDTVEFPGIGIDLGDNTLMKSGGTLCFNTYLIVSKKHRLSAAISATLDAGIDALALLCELCRVVLGLEKTADAPPGEKQPLPDGFARDYAGIYYSSGNVFDVSFADDCLTIRQENLTGWTDMVKDAPFDGEKFTSSPAFTFRTHGARRYLLQYNPIGKIALAEKPDGLPPVNRAWLNRSGKKYVLVDVNPWDAMAGKLLGGLTIKADSDHGLVHFITRGRFVPYGNMTALAADDDSTRMFLTAPRTGSRDTFAPFVWRVNGAEYIYDRGFTMMEADALPQLTAGTIAFGEGDCSKSYRIEAGKTLKLSHDGVRMILMDRDLAVLHDTLSDGPLTRAGEGYAILMAEGPATVEITE